MKRILITILFSLIMLCAFRTDSMNSPAIENVQQQHFFNHQTFGLYQNGIYGITGGVKKYDSYALGLQTQTGYRFRFEIYLMSRTQSVYGYKNITAYGMHVFVNNQNVTIAQYPYGVQGVITVEGTMVYVWETNDPMPVFSVTWQNLQ